MPGPRLVAAAALLVAGEAALLGLLTPRAQDLSASGSTRLSQRLCEPNPVRGFDLRPDQRLLHRTSEFRVAVRTNAWGLRGRTLPSPAEVEDSSFLRVLVVGGANVFGWGVPERERFTEELSRRLRPEFPSLRVVNAGCWGCGLDQQLMLVRDLLPQMKPHVVLQLIAPRSFALLAGWSRARRAMPPPPPRPAGPVAPDAWAEGIRLVREARATIAHSGARHLLVIPSPLDPPAEWPATVDRLRAAGARLIDLSPRTAGPPEERVFYKMARTWTRTGHERIAEALEDPLRTELEGVGFERARQDLTAIRDLVSRLEPRIPASRSRTEAALALRDMVHRRVPLAPTPPGFRYSPLYESFVAAILDPSTGHVCAGLAVTYMMALEAFGIPARYVGLQTAPVRSADTHATVEFHDGEAWIASDPTFNISIRREGRRLGWVEARRALRDGLSVELSTDGYRVAPERRIERYYVPLGRLVAYMVIYADADGDQRLGRDEILTFPDGWNGVLADDSRPGFQHRPLDVCRILGYHRS